MTFRMSMIAAVLLLSATAAHAGTTPTSTDEARAAAGSALPSSDTRPVATGARAPVGTDRDRTRGWGSDRASQPSGGEKSVAACGKSCSCKHG